MYEIKNKMQREKKSKVWLDFFVEWHISFRGLFEFKNILEERQ